MCAAVAGCSSFGDKNKGELEYKQSQRQPTLEIPPDLTEPAYNDTMLMPTMSAQASAAASQTASGNAKVFKVSNADVEVGRDGSLRWLIVNANADAMWGKLRDFWPTMGLELQTDEPGLGIMETKWQERLFDVEETSSIRKLIRKAFKGAYSSDTRDKYRLRLEAREDGRSEIFITHYGIAQVLDKDERAIWQVRPSEVELANEVMNRLALYLGGTEEHSQAITAAIEAQEKARLDNGMLLLDEEFNRAWRHIGIALDRIGVVVEDRNRSEGIYYISDADLLVDAGVKAEGGWLSRVFSSKGSDDDKLKQRIQITPVGTAVKIVVQDGTGQMDSSGTARKLLKRLRDELL